MSEPKRRRTQGERTAATMAKILNATLDALEEEGIASASTASIARRAGVSRGALVHHYSTKFDLVVAAVEHLLERAMSNIEALSGEVIAGEAGIEDVLDRLWRPDTRRLFMISLDYLSAARTDTELRDALTPLGQTYQQRLDTAWTALARHSGLQPDQAAVVLDMMLCLLRGMCLHTVLRKDEAYFDNILALWRASVPALMGR